ncbi:helix-turn-helix domain-containing protein [Nonomuraea sp. SBT364]|uniref:helix-turn-helix domain-containing protein n=1 Tax=Nonomuraea sp. SBT364 TaxID=1580530 RepID=UPI00066AB6E7|nr:helix-turn-helix domain-containing protein [Nonomuraea sp. SBT364]
MMDDVPFHVREPDTTATVAFRAGPGDGGELYVLGPRTRASYLEPKRMPHCVTVRLRPGRARPLLGVAMDELVDRIVPLRELWGARAGRLAGELAVATGPAGGDGWERRARALIEAAFLDRLAGQPRADLERGHLVDAAARLLPGSGVRAVASELGVSERHLRDVFTAGVGVAPKRFARIHRVRRVLGEVCRRPAAVLAADAGYYDQSHMTAEFREVMGVPPSAYRAGRLPAPAPCSAA